jgi:hypothetical protein
MRAEAGYKDALIFGILAALSFSMSNLVLKSEESCNSAYLCQVPSRMCFASKNLDFSTWGRETVFDLPGIKARQLLCRVAEAHDKARDRDATGCFEPLFALCFLFERVESQATQR